MRPSDVAIQILEVIGEDAWDQLDMDGRVIKLAKLIEHHMIPKQTPGPSGHLEVYTSELCIFKYCPNPMSCQGTTFGCIHPNNKIDGSL